MVVVNRLDGGSGCRCCQIRDDTRVVFGRSKQKFTCKEEIVVLDVTFNCVCVFVCVWYRERFYELEGKESLASSSSCSTEQDARKWTMAHSRQQESFHVPMQSSPSLHHICHAGVDEMRKRRVAMDECWLLPSDQKCKLLDVANLGDKVVELLLGLCVLLGHLLVLGLPLIPGAFEGLDFALIVAGLDVGLAESVMMMIESAKEQKISIVMTGNTLLVGLSQVLVGLFGFLFEQLQSPGQALVLGAVLSALVGSRLGVLEATLELLKLRLQQLVLV